MQRIRETGHRGVWDTKEGVRTQGRNEVWGDKEGFCYFLILRKETSSRQSGKETQVEMEKNGKVRKKKGRTQPYFLSVRLVSRQ